MIDWLYILTVPDMPPAPRLGREPGVASSLLLNIFLTTLELMVLVNLVFELMIGWPMVLACMEPDMMD